MPFSNKLGFILIEQVDKLSATITWNHRAHSRDKRLI
jgi:hypothetical protein